MGILLVRVSDEGLKSKSKTFRTLFYSILGLTTFFGVLIQALDHKENIRSNKTSFISYSSTQLRIYNYLMTDRLDLNPSNKKLDIDEFISSINREVNNINNITFGIEHDRIKSANEIIQKE